MDLSVIPETSNRDLSYLNRPKRLSLKEFEELPVSFEDLKLRNEIYELEEKMFGLPNALYGDRLDLYMTPIHHFTPGLYTRELTIPANYIVVGKRHAIEHQVLLMKGTCICVTERGFEYMTAPYLFVSPAGEKRVVITTDEEVTWFTFHPTEHTDLDLIEDDVIISEPERMNRYMKLIPQGE